MTNLKQLEKIEYGDFQTPLELARIICLKLVNMGVKPDIIIDPTCGIGNFLDASAEIFTKAKKIIGFDINLYYLRSFYHSKVEVRQADFFDLDLSCYFNHPSQTILIIGNFPWVTNSQQGIIRGQNLPQKSNFKGYLGLDAITGKSNFDISEWMLIRTIDQLQSSERSYMAMLCKTSVSRKILNYFRSQNYSLNHYRFYKIDTKQYFNVSVDAGLLFCEIKKEVRQYFCDIFADLDTKQFERIGYCNNLLVRNLCLFKKLSFLYASNGTVKWRSGIKHDCLKVMEFDRVNEKLINGFHESVEIEETYLFPLLKGSAIANNRIQSTHKYVLVPQRWVGEPTEIIQQTAPQTWNYLQHYSQYLDRRKSKIYEKNPRFSIFGVGDYTFYPWKIAIAGLYKTLTFRLISPLENQPVIFDDTVYFLAFEQEQEARKIFDLLTSQIAIDFYSCLIFWDEKRPLKASILNCLDLKTLEKFLSDNSKNIN